MNPDPGPSVLSVGVLVPCRNEAQVIERKLRNLAQLEGPAGGGSLRVLVVDDHSTDETRETVQRWMAEEGQGRIELVPNNQRPGKNGAIDCGLAELGQDLDVVILTDADVIVDRGAVREVCAAFQRDPGLGMACATQVFVEALPASGDAREAARAALADDRWDRMTRAVRRIESRFGMLFSVHGQWLAWRRDLGLTPARGVAADDVDLMIQARGTLRPRVCMLPDVRFYEEKPEAGSALDVQALRRARAWFQVFAHHGSLEGWGPFGKLQGLAYRHLPGAAPNLVVAGLALALVFFTYRWGAGGLALALVGFATVAFSSAGRAWGRTLRLIHQAKRLERASAMGEAWEMSRE